MSFLIHKIHNFVVFIVSIAITFVKKEAVIVSRLIFLMHRVSVVDVNEINKKKNCGDIDNLLQTQETLTLQKQTKNSYCRNIKPQTNLELHFFFQYQKYSLHNLYNGNESVLRKC